MCLGAVGVSESARAATGCAHPGSTWFRTGAVLILSECQSWQVSGWSVCPWALGFWHNVNNEIDVDFFCCLQ